MTTSTAIPVLTLLTITRTESQFLMAYYHENKSRDMQTVMQEIIAYTFNEKVMYLADRPNLHAEAMAHAKASRKIRITL